jgi:pimeloyl-ACP methyl ester carboxylesterase
MRLLRHPIFRGVGVPDGGGRPVLLIPGFLAGDNSLRVMRDWLQRNGYHVEMPGLTFNIRYSELVARRIAPRLLNLYGWLGRKVTVIGHSRGGILAKVIADRHAHLVERVVALGSLSDPYDIHPLTMAGVRLAHAFNLLRYARTGRVERNFLRDLEAPARVPLISVYTRSDGIVHWAACLRPDAECVEVRGSHSGLGVNVEVYQLLARLLPAEQVSPAPPGAAPGPR